MEIELENDGETVMEAGRDCETEIEGVIEVVGGIDPDSETEMETEMEDVMEVEMEVVIEMEPCPHTIDTPTRKIVRSERNFIFLRECLCV